VPRVYENVSFTSSPSPSIHTAKEKEQIPEDQPDDQPDTSDDRKLPIHPYSRTTYLKS
jgi:hypothetical protein